MVLVVGATGSLGGKIVGGLLERGDEVRALVRAESSDVDLKDGGASIAVGDLRGPSSLAAACRGVQVGISIIIPNQTSMNALA